MAWQQSARIGAALVGVGCAVAVYATLGTRDAAVAPPPPTRVDPTAVIETTGAVLQQLRGVRRDYRIEAEHQLTYADGTTRFLGVQVLVEDREGRDFLVAGGEGQAGARESDLEMTGGVTLSASDGFSLTTDRAVFSEETGLVRAPGPVSFSRGGLIGTGVGIAYDIDVDVLTIVAETAVTVISADGDRIEFTADSSVFDRTRQTLTLDGGVRILRDLEVLEAEHVNVELDERGERATFIALRDNARARTPGGALDSMRAASIDLDYTDDGRALERVGLNGGSELLLAPEAGAAAARRVLAEGIEVALAVDQTVRTLDAAGSTVLELPALDGPARRVTADGMQAHGDADGLRSAQFVGGVVFREDEGSPAPRRDVSAERLVIDFADGAVTRTVFTGGARFDDGALSAFGLELHYIPDGGGLSLRGAVGWARPRIDDGRLTVEAETLDLLLGDPLTVVAAGNVQTTLAGGASTPGGSRLPALLDGRLLVNIGAEAFEYGGVRGRAIYTGNAVLWQGDTTIRADRLTLDQASGDLVAEGGAQSAFMLDGEASIGTAATIRYEESGRVVTYSNPDAAAISSGTGAVAGTTRPGRVPTVAARPSRPPVVSSRLSGPQGDLEAREIVVSLAADEAEVERIEATSNVRLLLGARTATGDRLTYDAAGGQYAMRGTVDAPAVLVDECRQTEGRSLLFLADGDRVVVDSDQDVRTRTANTPCPRPGGQP